MIKDDNVMRLLKQVQISIETQASIKGKEAGPTVAQSNILSYLFAHQEEEICSTRLHTVLGLSKATVSSVLKKMRRDGYLRFETDDVDGRQKRIILTVKAKSIEQDMERQLSELQEMLYHGFSIEEKQTVEELLKRMLLNLRESRGRQ